jgi:hypothetical protein
LVENQRWIQGLPARFVTVLFHPPHKPMKKNVTTTLLLQKEVVSYLLSASAVKDGNDATAPSILTSTIQCTSVSKMD